MLEFDLQILSVKCVPHVLYISVIYNLTCVMHACLLTSFFQIVRCTGCSELNMCINNRVKVYTYVRLAVLTSRLDMRVFHMRELCNM